MNNKQTVTSKGEYVSPELAFVRYPEDVITTSVGVGTGTYNMGWWMD